MLAGGFWATPATEPTNNIPKIETRIGVRIIQDQPLNSDWMPRLTLESTDILARSSRNLGAKTNPQRRPSHAEKLDKLPQGVGRSGR
jgi:hypothetical protein